MTKAPTTNFISGFNHTAFGHAPYASCRHLWRRRNGGFRLVASLFRAGLDTRWVPAWNFSVGFHFLSIWVRPHRPLSCRDVPKVSEALWERAGPETPFPVPLRIATVHRNAHRLGNGSTSSRSPMEFRSGAGFPTRG